MKTAEFKILPGRGPAALVVQGNSARAFGRHHHDEYGLGLMQSGGHRSASGRGQVEASAGDLITVNPGEVHDGFPVGGSPRRWRMLYIEPAVLSAVWRDQDGIGTRNFEFEFPVQRHSGHARHLHELIEKCSGRPVHDDLRIDELFVALLARLSSTKPTRDLNCKGVPGSVRRAFEIMRDQPAGPHSLAELARVTELGRFQLIRAVQRATGLTPHAYLVQCRLSLARSLLIRGAPIAAAAVDSGFCDQSHLNRVFVRTFGYTPGVFAQAFH